MRQIIRPLCRSVSVPVLGASLALLAGVMVYVSARAPGSAWFLPASWSMALPWPERLLPLAGNLPSFFHTLGFCLLLSLSAGAGRQGAAWLCGTWFVVEAAFETGQHPAVSPWLVAHLPAWMDQVWLLERSRSYFSAGVFDPLDMVAAAAGAVAALLLLFAYEHERSADHEQST